MDYVIELFVPVLCVIVLLSPLLILIGKLIFELNSFVEEQMDREREANCQKNVCDTLFQELGMLSTFGYDPSVNYLNLPLVRGDIDGTVVTVWLRSDSWSTNGYCLCVFWETPFNSITVSPDEKAANEAVNLKILKFALEYTLRLREVVNPTTHIHKPSTVASTVACSAECPRGALTVKDIDTYICATAYETHRVVGRTPSKIHSCSIRTDDYDTAEAKHEASLNGQ